MTDALWIKRLHSEVVLNDTSVPIIGISNGRHWFITGVAGFIGSNMASFLLERGEFVTGLDNFFSGKRANIDRLERCFGDRFTFVEGDILDKPKLELVMTGCAAVVHLAAQVSVMRSIDMADETHEINTKGFLNVLQAAQAVGAESLIYASSCAVYGDNDTLPLVESFEPRPMSPYAASKLANEAYAKGFRSLDPNLNIIGLRFFNVFGAWQDATGGYAAVIPKWINILLSGKKPVLYGDGSTTRDFCHIENICRAIWQSNTMRTAANGGVFNVASGIPTRLDELYNTIAHTLMCFGLIQNFPRPDYLPLRAGEILHSFGNPSKAAAILDFNVEVTLTEGLKRMLKEEYTLNISQSKIH